MDSNELYRKFKRIFDGNLSYRKLFIILVCVTVIFLYIGPGMVRWFRSPQHIQGKLVVDCNSIL